MNNEELKKKIISALQSVEFVTEKGWCGQCISLRLDYSAIADALIAAGIGDVKDLQAQVNVLEITNIALQAGYDDAEKDRLYWVNKYKEAEHRADVAERALNDCVEYYSWSGLCPVLDCNYNKACWQKKCTSDIAKCFKIQAEKELADGGER